MESLLSVGQDILIVVVGLIVRFVIAVVGFALLLAPVVLVMAAFQKVGSLRDRAAGLDHAGSLKWLKDAAYAPWHTWLAPVGAGLSRTGVDALGERLLGHVTGIAIAAPGTQVRAGETLARITCGDHTATLRAPADSLVVAVNEEVERQPQLLHRDPYRRGWLAVVAPSAGADRDLRRGEPARRWLAQEEHRLQIAFESALGFAAADGGDLVGPAHRLLTAEQWDRLTREFL